MVIAQKEVGSRRQIARFEKLSMKLWKLFVKIKKQEDNEYVKWYTKMPRRTIAPAAVLFADVVSRTVFPQKRDYTVVIRYLWSETQPGWYQWNEGSSTVLTKQQRKGIAKEWLRIIDEEVMDNSEEVQN